MTSDRTQETGYMTLIAGLLDVMEEVNGVDVTEEIMHMNGKQRGEHVGKKLGKNMEPQAAMNEFFEYVRTYYDIEIEKETATKNGCTADIRFTGCMIKNLCRDRGLSIKSPLCKSTHGFIEGALSTMTGMQVNMNTHTAGWDTCLSKVEFKQKRNKFSFL